jgi:hypothetical protein
MDACTDSLAKCRAQRAFQAVLGIRANSRPKKKYVFNWMGCVFSNGENTRRLDAQDLRRKYV